MQLLYLQSPPFPFTFTVIFHATLSLKKEKQITRLPPPMPSARFMLMNMVVIDHPSVHAALFCLFMYPLIKSGTSNIECFSPVHIRSAGNSEKV